MIEGLQLLFIAAAAQGLTVDSETIDLFPERPEYCRTSEGRDIDLLTVTLLKNDRLDLSAYSIPAVVIIDRDWIDVRSKAAPVRSYKQDIGYAAMPGESLDLDLSIALYQGRPLLHWKETFKHRAARLGLMTFKPNGHVEPLCVGGPTVTVSH